MRNPDIEPHADGAARYPRDERRAYKLMRSYQGLERSENPNRNPMQAVQRVIAGDVQRAFAVVRPPGHHAECERAQGFCLFNNTALAALAGVAAGLTRILILDWVSRRILTQGQSFGETQLRA